MRKNKALFLDRDGVINVYHPYVHSREEFQFQEGIFDLCRAAQSRNYHLLVVTNQAGIARGYFTEPVFLELTEWMLDRFAEQAIYISRVYYCPYHPVHGVGRYKSDSPFRKPNPGMFLRARTDFSLDLAASVLIGDQQLDIDAAKAAGVGTKILFPPGMESTKAKADHFYISHSLGDIRRRFFPPLAED